MTTQPLVSMDRVRLLPKPIHSPGKCAICGAVDRPVIEFGLEIDVYGVVYICEFDLRNIAQVIDLVPRETLSDNEREAGSIVSDYCRQKNLRLVSDEFLDAFIRANGILGADIISGVLDAPGYADAEEEPAGDSTDSRVDSIQDSSDESGTANASDESANGEGPASVPADASDADPFGL